MSTAFSASLAAAELRIVAWVPSTPGGLTPQPLLDELSTFYSQRWTARIADDRDSREIAAWLGENLATLGDTASFYVMDHLVDRNRPVGSTARWVYVDAGTDRGWLAKAWCTRPGSLLVVSEDGARVLLVLQDPAVSFVHALAYSTADALALRAEHARLDRVLAATPGLVRVDAGTARVPIVAHQIYGGPPSSTLSGFSADAQRDGWFLDALERWRNQAAPLRDRHLADLGPFEISLANTICIATLGAYVKTPSVLLRLWAAAGHDRLVLFDDDRRRAFALCVGAAGFEARSVVLE